jgi:peroxiredoxin Q/BCP
MALAEGTKAPSFKGQGDGGSTLSLASFKGSWLVLYFYPKDATSGCTTEACDFRDSMSRLSVLDVHVVGVSPDSVKSHDSFKAKFELPFALLADTEKEVCQAYDVWKEKSMYGRKYMGVERTTYIIDPKGKIVRVFEKVKVPGHVDAVIAAINELQGAS